MATAPASFDTLEAEWARVASRWLPREIGDSIWRFSRPSPAELPRQGWKLHVSATIRSAVPVLEAVAPLLHRQGALFKGPSSLVVLKRLNCGLFYGYSQIGKFLTVYPVDDAQACDLARQLDTATRDLQGPVVPFELPVATDSSVFTRYGAFGSSDEGGAASSVRAPDGTLVEDQRDRNPPWATYPPGLIRDGQVRGRTRQGPGPLATTFRAFQALSQRGKGGVYRALDLSQRPARLCVVKEGRAGGELDWDGSDGRRRVQREAVVLTELRHGSVPVPEVYASFEQGGNFYLALEWITGERLTEILRPDNDLLSVERALDLGRQIALLVAQIHEHGWIWRDLKAANLLLAAGGKLRPIDFEGAVRAGSWVRSPWGTTGYAPPEWMQIGRVGFSQDAYALGVLLHQLFTNIVPVSDRPSPIESSRPDAPPGIGRLITGLTRASPRQRTSAKVASRALEAMCRDHRAD